MKKSLNETQKELESIIAKELTVKKNKKYNLPAVLCVCYFVVIMIFLTCSQSLPDFIRQILAITAILGFILYVVLGFMTALSNDKDIYQERDLRRYQEQNLIHKILRDTYCNCDSRDGEARTLILETPLTVSTSSDLMDYGSHHVFINKDNVRVDLCSLDITSDFAVGRSGMESNSRHFETVLDGVLLKFNGINEVDVDGIVFDNEAEAFLYRNNQYSLKYLMNTIYLTRPMWFLGLGYRHYETKNQKLEERYRVFIKKREYNEIVTDNLIARILKLRFEYSMSVTVFYKGKDAYLFFHDPLLFLHQKDGKAVINNLKFERYHKILTDLNEISENIRLSITNC